MPLGLPLGALVLLLFQPARQMEEEVKGIKVEISSGKVLLRCPEENSQWWPTNSQLENTSILNISSPDELFEIERGKRISCGQKNGKSWKIYLKIKGCQDCVELSFGLGAGIIMADLLFTLIVLLLVYFCSQKQQALFRSGAPRQLQEWRRAPRRLIATTGKTGQQTDQPPPVPNPDYEPIRKGQREVYAGLEPHGF